MNFDKIAVIGKTDNIMGFKAAGVEVFASNTSADARAVLHSIKNKGYAVILITEDLAAEMTETLSKYKTKAYPAVIPIPTAQGISGIGMKGVMEDADKAIGADLLFRQ